MNDEPKTPPDNKAGDPWARLAWWLEWLGGFLIVGGALLGLCPLLIVYWTLSTWFDGAELDQVSLAPSSLLLACAVTMVGAGAFLARAPRWSRRDRCGSGNFFVVAAVAAFLALACAAAAVVTIIQVC